MDGLVVLVSVLSVDVRRSLSRRYRYQPSPMHTSSLRRRFCTWTTGLSTSIALNLSAVVIFSAEHRVKQSPSGTTLAEDQPENGALNHQQ